MTNFVSRFCRFVLKLVLAAFGLVFVVSLMAVAVAVLVFSLLKSLITGKKTAPAMIFSRFQKFSPQGMWSGASGRAGGDGGLSKPNVASDVVDVEVREIKGEPDKRLH